jgi:cell division protease FtsH
VLEIFAPVKKRAVRGTYTGYGKRVPSDRPPVLTQKELALTAASDASLDSAKGLGAGANGQSAPPAGHPGSSQDEVPSSEDG